MDKKNNTVSHNITTMPLKFPYILHFENQSLLVTKPHEGHFLFLKFSPGETDCFDFFDSNYNPALNGNYTKTYNDLSPIKKQIIEYFLVITN